MTTIPSLILPGETQIDREAPRVAGEVLLDQVAEAVGAWTQRTPTALALLHKQYGRWGGYRWKDVADTVAGLRDALASRGVGAEARLLVSGAFEPHLLLMTLAAHAAGARVITIDRFAEGHALEALLREAAPTHAFVQERRNLSAWIDCGFVSDRPLPLYCSQPVARESRTWSITPLLELGASSPAREPGGTLASPRERGALWVDEGTEWRAGLGLILTQWLESGAILAAPEISASSTRDRQEIGPRRLLVSEGRLQRIQEELQARLPVSGSGTLRLAGLGAGRPGNAVHIALSNRILNRIDRLHGLPPRARPLDLSASVIGEVAS